jgi:hypothetical protein
LRDAYVLALEGERRNDPPEQQRRSVGSVA